MKVHPIVLRQLEVAHVAQLTPRALRITLTGEELAPFSRDGIDLPGFASPGFDDHVKLIFNSLGPVEEALPQQVDGGIDWTRAPGRQTRDYTPRTVRQAADGSWSVDLDFVLHADGASASGPAERWAQSARRGDPLWIVGPKSSTRLPRDTEEIVLLADETGLPAVARFFDERPSDAPVRAFITIPCEQARQELASREQDSVAWIVATPGDPDALVDAVQGLEESVWDRHVYVWGGAESRALLPVRRYLSKVRAVPRSHVDLTGYWHADLHDGDRGSSAASEPVQATTAAPRPVADLQSPVRWLAVRAALRMGLLEALEHAPTSSVQDLATRLKVRPEALDGLLPVLQSCDVVAGSPGAYTLGDFGTELLADEHAAEDFVGLEADAILSLDALPSALASDTPAWRVSTGSSVAQRASVDPEIAEHLAESASGLQFLAPSLAALPVFAGPLVDLAGPGAEAVQAAVTSQRGEHAGRRELTHAWPAAAAPAAPNGAHASSTAMGATPAAERPRALVLAHALGHLSDAEALLALRAAAGYDEVVVIESTQPDALSPRAAESALVTVALTGTAPRPADAVQRLAAAAGLQPHGVAQIGWGREALSFTPALAGEAS